MSGKQRRLGKAFQDLHKSDGLFVMPNAWNAGSAAMLKAAGFPAIGTTNAGIAFWLGLPDCEGASSKQAALDVQPVSFGGSLARATFGLIRQAAREMQLDGTFTYAAEQIPDAELYHFFADRTAG